MFKIGSPRKRALRPIACGLARGLPEFGCSARRTYAIRVWSTGTTLGATEG